MLSVTGDTFPRRRAAEEAEADYKETDIKMVCDDLYRQSRSMSLPCIPETSLESLRKRPFSKNQVSLGRLLGSGGFGSVYMGKYGTTKVAVKVMHTMTKNPQAQLQSFKAELSILYLRHPHIVRTLTATALEDYTDGAWVIMEFVGMKTLQGIINDPEEDICMYRRLKFSLQLASALNFIHDNCIVHLDIKPANILLTPEDDCKLGDFGCCQEVESNTGRVSPTNRSALTGTFAYRAPELLKGGVPCLQADVYSLGVTLWQMLSRETPYANENQHVVIFGVVAYGLRPKHPDVGEDPFDKLYQDLYAQCWMTNPEDRPSSCELLEVLDEWKEHM